MRPRPATCRLDRGHPLARGLVGAWAFDTPWSGRVEDQSGCGNHGVLTSMDPAGDWVRTERGWVLDFDGANDLLDCGTGRMPSSAATLEIWFWPRAGFSDSAPDDEYLIELSVDGSDRAFLLLESTNGKLRGLVAKGGTIRICESAQSAWQERWYHAALTWDAAETLLYVDGGLQPDTDPGHAISPPTLVRIAGRRDNGRTFDGRVAKASVYDRALPASAVQALYANPWAIYRPRAAVPPQAAAPGRVPWHLFPGRAA